MSTTAVTPTLTTYMVRWEIELDATGPYAAAEYALEIQRDPASQGLCFTVWRADDQCAMDADTIDLMDEQTEDFDD